MAMPISACVGWEGGVGCCEAWWGWPKSVGAAPLVRLGLMTEQRGGFVHWRGLDVCGASF